MPTATSRPDLPSAAEIKKQAHENERSHRHSVKQYVAGIGAGCFETMHVHHPNVRDCDYRSVMRGIARLETVPDHIREWALDWWCRSGSHIRQEVHHDRVLLDALRILLPAYDGPALQLYRGDAAKSRRGPSYGPAWSSERDVAEAHARGYWRVCPGGSVLLSTFASDDAIICNVGEHNNDYGEDEYIVDRRRLPRVDVLERYSQVDHDALESDEI